MPYRTNFWKSIIGDRPQVIMSLGVAYTSQTTYENFVANSAEGELGFFNNDTHALISGGGAAATNINIFVAVNRGGTKGIFSNAPQVPNVIERSTVFQIQNATMFRQPYDAPIAQVSLVILNSHASLKVGDITYVAKAAGGTSPITITNVVAGASTPLSIGVVGNAITVNLATNAGSAAISTAAQVIAAIQASGPASALVTANLTGVGSNVQAAAASTNLAGGSAAATITAGSVYQLGILDKSIGYQPFPTYLYQSVGLATSAGVVLSTEDLIMTDLANQINSTTSIANKDRDIIVSAAYANGIMTLTALYFGLPFSVYFPGLQFPALATDNQLSNIATTTTITTPHAGSGYADQVRLFQLAGDVAKGITTQYPEQGARPEDYGQPHDFVALNVVQQFDIFSLKIGSLGGQKNSNAQQFFVNLFIIVPTSGTTPTAQVKAILGL